MSQQTGRLSLSDGDLRAWEQSVEEEGALPAGSLRQGRLTLISSDRNWAVWTARGGIVACRDVELAADLARVVGRHDGRDLGPLSTDLRRALTQRLPSARCDLFLTAFRPPAPARVSPRLHARVEKINPEALSAGDTPPSGVEHAFAITYGPTIVSDARSFARLRVGDHWLHEVGVATHQGSRRRGYARAVLCALLDHLASEGAPAVWRCAAANAPSVRLARSLGFVEHVWTLTWQLGEAGASE